MNCFDVCFSVCETPFGWNIGLLFWELLFIGALIGLIAYKLAIWVYKGYKIGKSKNSGG